MLETLARRDSRKIANNTYLTRETEPAAAVIRLHGHPVVTAYPTGAVTIDQCGWPTLTTRDRINAFFSTYRDNIPVRDSRVWQYETATYRKVTSLYAIDAGGWTTLGAMPASGPVTLGPRGAVHGLESPARTRADAKLRRDIADYARDLQHALPLTLPGPGDCMYCSTIDGSASRGKLPKHVSRAHLLEHVRERYYVPALVWNALLYNGCTPQYAGSAYFQAAFVNKPTLGGFASERVAVFVQRYLERCLQVA